MKKQYINPEIDMLECVEESLLTDSGSDKIIKTYFSEEADVSEDLAKEFSFDSGSGVYEGEW